MNTSAKAAEKAQKKAEKEAAKAQKKAEKEAAKAQKKAEKEAAKAQKKAEKEKKSKKPPIIASDITLFTSSSIREENDKTNTLRERILENIVIYPNAFVDDPDYGSSWKNISQKFLSYLESLYSEKYTALSIKRRGGRKYNYDFDVTYLNDAKPVTTKKIEFKYGEKKIDRIPQFYSPHVHNVDISGGPTYDSFFYDVWLDKYIAEDSGITEKKPERDEYLKLVKQDNYDSHPFFRQLYDRDNEDANKVEKDGIVNDSIKEYLNVHASLINVSSLTKTFRETQLDKHYALWSDDQFHYDRISEAELTGLVFDSISKTGNTAILRAGNLCEYKLLLRWRNHKGVLTPAWQIAMRRLTVSS